MPQTHYERLGLTQSASALEIKERYRALAKELHPDRASRVEENEEAEGAGALTEEERLEAMSALNEAYHVLSDPERRAAYDAELAFEAEQARLKEAPPEPFTPQRPRWMRLVMALSLCAVTVVIILNTRSPNKRQLMDEYQAVKPLLEPRLKAVQRGEMPSLKEGLESPEGLLLKGVLSPPTPEPTVEPTPKLTPERCLEAFPERLKAR